MTYKKIYYTNDEFIYVVDESFDKNHSFVFNGTNKNNIWEEQSLHIFYNIVKNDNRPIKNIIDVGANVGLYSLYAKFLQNTNFYSFEPFKKTFDVLNKNIELNNITNVKTFNIGLSDKKETKELKISFDNNGLNTLGDNPLRFNTDDVTLIEVDTIDNLFYDKNIEVNYIKIDTEGFEYYILTGAKKTIEKYKPIIQLEWNKTNMNQSNVSEDMLNKLLEEIEYKEIGFVEEEKLLAPK
jgi:FkbM family methyltransferase